jgi:hypothetical protein
MTGKHVVIVTGGRHRPEEMRPFVAYLLDALREQFGDFALTHGACGLESPDDLADEECWQRMRGADRYADDWARVHPSIDLRRRPADWPRWGRRAGPLRNREMVTEALEIAPAERIHGLAFPDPRPSRGTWDCVGAMEARGIAVDIRPPRLFVEWLEGSQA